MTVAAALILVPPAGCSAWMLRDPVPTILERRSSLSDVRVEVMSRDNGHVNERVVLGAESGMRVEMILRRPDRSEDAAPVDPSDPRPVFLILGGYRTGDKAATLIPDTKGNIVAALSYPFDGDLGVKGLRVIPEVPNIRKAILDTPGAIMLAIDYLLTRADIDSSRVELVGASFGAPFTCVAAALDQRVTRVWSVHGAARPYDQIELNLRRNISFGPLRRSVALAATIFSSAPRLDPARWVGDIAPRQFIMINALQDERMPRPAIDALYQAAAEPKELIWLEGQHVHRSRPQVLAALVETVLERAGRRSETN